MTFQDNQRMEVILIWQEHNYFTNQKRHTLTFEIMMVLGNLGI